MQSVHRGKRFLENEAFSMLIGETKLKRANENHSSEDVLHNSSGSNRYDFDHFWFSLALVQGTVSPC